MRQTLSAAQERIILGLRHKGIVITSIGELTGDTTLFEELETAVWNYETAFAKDIDAHRMNATAPIPDRNKGYVFALLGSRPMLNPNEVFVRFALQPQVLAIANAYFGMLTKLRYYNVWHNFPTHAPARESQLWHRDPEDRCILKMFVYLTEVDEAAGPLTYAPETQSLGAVKTRAQSRIFREGRSYVHRSNDVQMNEVIPENQWVTAVGPQGTVVFVDTKGYHKGGFSISRERILYTCMFTSQASACPNLFTREHLLPMPTDQSVRFAIGA